MNKLYLLDIGFVEDTVIYELVPKEVSRLRGATVNDIAEYLQNNNINQLVIDSAQPSVIDAIKQRRVVKKVLKTLRLPKAEKK